jgi:DNA polymerase-3 subunit beta
MRFKVSRNVILPAVSTIGSIVEKRQTLPILSNMLVRVSESNLNLTATDLEVGINTEVNVDTNSEGEFTLPARKFIDICKALPEGSVIDIEIDGDKAQIRSGRSKFILGILSAADYPAIEISNAEYSFDIKEKDLKNLIDKTSFSMAHQDVRYYLNGMLIELEKDKIKAISTDGHRLAMCEKTIEERTMEARSFLLPRKAVMEISRLLEYTDTEVSVELSSNLARFKIENTIFTTKLIDGKFPDYERVIPRNCDKTAIIDKELFRNALIRASILSSEKYKGIRITVDDGLLKLQAHNPEQEEAEEELEIEYRNESMTIGFNVGYLLDILSTISTDTIAIDFADTSSSSIIRIPEDMEALYVVMPMRL